MNNLSVHKSRRVQQSSEAQGCPLLFLPAYSPDLTPIESAFAKLKTFLRRMGDLSVETLHEVISAGLDRMSAQDAHGYFHSCGFRFTDQPA